MLTPKEKSEELIGRYRKFKVGLSFCFLSNKEAKECALIAAKEVVAQWFIVDTYIGDGRGELNPNYRYWLEVERELNKL